MYSGIDESCVMCDSRVEEDVVHFLVGCGGFESSGWMNFESG